jgi:hypothetical protein
VQKAEAKGLISQWATKYTSKRGKPSSSENINLTEEDLKDFAKTLRDGGLDFNDCHFEEAKEDFRRILTMEIAYQYFGEMGRYRVFLKFDPVFKEAVKRLSKAQKTEDLFSKR